VSSSSSRTCSGAMGCKNPVFAWLQEALLAERHAVNEALTARHAILLNDLTVQLLAAGNHCCVSAPDSRPEAKVALGNEDRSETEQDSFGGKLRYEASRNAQDNALLSCSDEMATLGNPVSEVVGSNDMDGNRTAPSSRPTIRTPRKFTGTMHQDTEPEMDNKKCSLVYRFVTGAQFEVAMAMLIVANAIILTVEAQIQGHDVGFKIGHPGSKQSADETWPGARDAFRHLETFFGIVFTVELLLRAVALRIRFFKECWNIVDTFIVLAWLMSHLGSSPLPIDPMLLRMARLARLLRLLRLIRSIQLFDSLYLMTTAISGSVSVLMWSIALLTIAQMVISIVLQNQLQDFVLDEGINEATRLEVFKFFGTFTRNMLTMFEITLGNWMVPCRTLVENVSEWYSLFFLFHRLVIGFSVVAVMTAVFISETFKVAAVDDRVMMMNRERASKTHMKKVTVLFHHADTDGDGCIDVDEFENVLHDPDIATWLSAMELEVHNHLELFELLDTNGDGSISAFELVDGVRRLKGSAKNYDVMTLQRTQQEIMASLRELSAVMTRHLNVKGSVQL